MNKRTDQRDAKVEFWVAAGRVVPLPQVAVPPAGAARKFSSYEDFNRWKRERILRMARHEHA